MNLARLLNLGGSDLIIILLIVLLLFGAKKLPDHTRGFGEALSEFLKALDEVRGGLRQRLGRFDRKPGPGNLFNVFASLLLFVALTVFLLALAGGFSH
jgi:TatA/E family protein of Tat protein translocase